MIFARSYCCGLRATLCGFTCLVSVASPALADGIVGDQPATIQVAQVETLGAGAGAGSAAAGTTGTGGVAGIRSVGAANSGGAAGAGAAAGGVAVSEEALTMQEAFSSSLAAALAATDEDADQSEPGQLKMRRALQAWMQSDQGKALLDLENLAEMDSQSLVLARDILFNRPLASIADTNLTSLTGNEVGSPMALLLSGTLDGDQAEEDGAAGAGTSVAQGLLAAFDALAAERNIDFDAGTQNGVSVFPTLPARSLSQAQEQQAINNRIDSLKATYVASIAVASQPSKPSDPTSITNGEALFVAAVKDPGTRDAYLEAVLASEGLKTFQVYKGFMAVLDVALTKSEVVFEASGATLDQIESGNFDASDLDLRSLSGQIREIFQEANIDEEYSFAIDDAVREMSSELGRTRQLSSMLETATARFNVLKAREPERQSAKASGVGFTTGLEADEEEQDELEVEIAELNQELEIRSGDGFYTGLDKIIVTMAREFEYSRGLSRDSGQADEKVIREQARIFTHVVMGESATELKRIGNDFDPFTSLDRPAGWTYSRQRADRNLDEAVRAKETQEQLSRFTSVFLQDVTGGADDTPASDPLVALQETAFDLVESGVSTTTTTTTTNNNNTTSPNTTSPTTTPTPQVLSLEGWIGYRGNVDNGIFAFPANFVREIEGDSTGEFTLTAGTPNADNTYSSVTPLTTGTTHSDALDDFEYTSLGIWTVGGSFDQQGTFAATHTIDPNFGAFVMGEATPAGSLPTTGSATYTGQTIGIDSLGVNTTGVATLTVDFANSSLNATLNSSHSGLGVGVTLSNTFTGVAIDNNNAYSQQDGFNRIDGQFFGPNGEETGGGWLLSDPGGTTTAAGTFRAKQ